MKTSTLISALFIFLAHNAFSNQNALLFHDEIPLSEAVAELNSIASKNKIGKNEPALSTEEIIASIRGILFDRIPPMDSEYKKILQQISDTGKLPADSRLSFTTRWSNYNGYDFTVWWIDLFVKPANPNKMPKELRLGYNFRIRDRFISSTPH